MMHAIDPTVVGIDTADIGGLLDLARAGDAEAFGEVCRVHETRLLRQAMDLCRNATAAEDLAQDTLVEAWRCLPRFNGRCQFFTWLCAILLHRYYNQARQKRPVPLSSLTGYDHNVYQDRIDGLVDPGSRPDQTAERREQAALILECIQLLPAKHQQVVYLRFFVDGSLPGIAAALGCSVGTVKSRLFRALDKLRAMNALDPQIADLEPKAGSA